MIDGFRTLTPRDGRHRLARESSRVVVDGASTPRRRAMMPVSRSASASASRARAPVETMMMMMIQKDASASSATRARRWTHGRDASDVSTSSSFTSLAREARARVEAARRDAEAFAAGATTRALRDARRATDRALGARASEFFWTMSEMNPMVVKRAVEQRVVSGVRTNRRVVEAAATAAVGTATWRLVRGFKRDALGATCESNVFDVAFGDPAMLVGSMLLAGVGAFALRKRWTLDVEHAVRAATKRLETHASVREILGAPVTASASYACVTSGGGLALFKRAKSRVFGAATFPVSVDSKWAHVAFELRGTRKTGVAYLASRKWAGVYETPLLAVEVASRDGELYRVFIEGSVKDFETSALPALRDVLAANSRDADMTRARRETDAHDAARAAELAAERRAARAPKPLAEGGGMYPHERAADAAGNAALFVRKTLSKMRVTSS
jgi:hypothetical protein